MTKHTEEEYAALEAQVKMLRETVKDAEHLCKWLLQSDISNIDRMRVIRENAIDFALAATDPSNA